LGRWKIERTRCGRVALLELHFVVPASAEVAVVVVAEALGTGAVEYWWFSADAPT